MGGKQVDAQAVLDFLLGLQDWQEEYSVSDAETVATLAAVSGKLASLIGLDTETAIASIERIATGPLGSVPNSLEEAIAASGQCGDGGCDCTKFAVIDDNEADLSDDEDDDEDDTVIVPAEDWRNAK